ncbi:MAG TPA: hypothetical protein VN936_02430 [Candidatus Acidoferrum sp.]|nr:hypothetical protein [Candidatus Acidoferrum sp.]
MMTDPLRVSVLAAPLAAIDPRALSQAWYSALHLARERPTQTPQSRATSGEPQRLGAAPAKTEVASREPHRAMQPCRARAGSAARGVTGEPLAHRARATFTRRIELAPARRSGPSGRAAFVVVDGSKRALIVLQTRGATTHVVAICAPAHRQAVAFALSQVRAALAARGLAFRSRIEATPACS